ncbi:MAG: hypothetical protein ACR2H6_01025 [Pyrinomonadaceae bacterium]
MSKASSLATLFKGLAMYRAIARTVKAVAPIWRIIDAVLGWEGLGVAFLFPFGWVALERRSFGVARFLFTVATIFLALRVISRAQKLFETRKTRTLGSLGGVFLVFLAWIGLWYWVLRVESQANGLVPPTLLQWIGRHLGNLSTIPWDSFLMTGVGIGLIGFLLMAFARLRRDRCPDTRLHVMATNDKASIRDKVRVVGISYQPCFDPDGPYLDFVVSVFNGSLFDINIKNEIDQGYVWNITDSKKFYYPASIESDQTIQLKSRKDNFFIIRQPLRFEEVPGFKGKDKVLGFGNLEIVFKGETIIPETTLDMNHTIETKKGGWRAWDQVGFITSYTPEQWVAIQSGNIAHSIELAELRAKLKDKDLPPSSLAAPEIVVFAPYVASVAKETDVGKYVKTGKNYSGHNKILQAVFLDVHLKASPKTVGNVDVSANMVLTGNQETTRVNAGIWYGRDSAKVPLRHNETQTLFVALYDQGLTTYEHQHKQRPLETSIAGETVYVNVHVFVEYENGQNLPLDWYLRLSGSGKSVTAALMDEKVFKEQATALFTQPVP